MRSLRPYPYARFRSRRAVVAVAAFAALPALLAAQGEWRRAVPTGATRQAAYDPVRRQVMLQGFGSAAQPGTETWFWDGAHWVGTSHATPLPTFLRFGLVTDTTRGDVVLLGTRDQVTMETWTWNGTDWRPRAGALQPPPRYEFPMAFDAARGRVVLFAGAMTLTDTWEWDGAAWTLCRPAVVPPVLAAHAMAYDAARQRTILFGGVRANTQVSNETWEWDGANWTRLLPPNSPPPLRTHGMAYDSARRCIVVHGPSQPFGNGDTWEWNGTTWLQSTAAPPSVFATNTQLVEDVAAGCIVLASAWQSGRWDYDGSSWTRRSGPMLPQARVSAAMVFEPVRGRSVLFGGYRTGTLLADTWEWDGRAWSDRTPPIAPQARCEHAMAHDPLRSRTLLFGGTDGFAAFGDTWEWDGAGWQRVLGAAPSPRRHAAMTYDVARQQVLLFGGRDGTTWFDDTWTWNGATWTQLAPATRPLARYGAALVHDETAGAPLLFGGAALPLQPVTATPTPLADTWRFTGSTWQQLQPAASPSGRWNAGVASDAHRRVIVLFGGNTQSGLSDDTWEWDGSTWAAASPARGPGLRSYVGATYDLLRRQVVLFGGYDGTSPSDETLVYAPRGEHTVYGTGCAGTLGVPVLTPAPGSTATFGGRVAATVANVPAGIAAMALELASPFAAVPAAPMPLGGIGMPGCGAWLTPALLVPLVASGGTAEWQLDVPWAMALQGMQLFQQAIVLDPPANAAGLTVSNAARVRVGT